MKRIHSGAKVAVIAGALLLGPSIQARAESDPKAVAVADEVLEAMGGKDAWNGTHFLRFDFAVESGGKTVVSRAHTWDKWTGRYRLEAKTKAGDPYVALMNINT